MKTAWPSAYRETSYYGLLTPGDKLVSHFKLYYTTFFAEDKHKNGNRIHRADVMFHDGRSLLAECGTCPDETNVKKPINIRQGGLRGRKKGCKIPQS